MPNSATPDVKPPGSNAPHPHVVHVISGLGLGGAELNLKTLVTGLKPQFEQTVVDMGDGGPVAEQLSALGVDTISLNLRERPLVGGRRFYQLLRERTPDVLHGWMYQGNLLASMGSRITSGAAMLPRKLSGHTPPAVFWSVRHHLAAWHTEKFGTQLLVRMGGWPLWGPQQVLYNARSAVVAHAERGYARYPTVLLPNALDTERYRADPERGAVLRQALGIAAEQPLVGLVGRYHDLKNIPLFLGVARRVLATRADVQFVLAGTGMTEANGALMAQLLSHDLQSKVRLLGPQSQPESLYNALDLLLSTSLSEAMSNVILEALACACPCIATNVGDARLLLPDELLIASAAVGADEQLRLMSDRVLSLLTNPAHAVELAQRASCELVETHQAGTVVAQLADLYHSALDTNLLTKAPRTSV